MELIFASPIYKEAHSSIARIMDKMGPTICILLGLVDHLVKAGMLPSSTFVFITWQNVGTYPYSYSCQFYLIISTADLEATPRR